MNENEMERRSKRSKSMRLQFGLTELTTHSKIPRKDILQMVQQRPQQINDVYLPHSQLLIFLWRFRSKSIRLWIRTDTILRFTFFLDILFCSISFERLWFRLSSSAQAHTHTPYLKRIHCKIVLFYTQNYENCSRSFVGLVRLFANDRSRLNVI